ncbi:MAG: hypothetical protein ACOCXA_07915 [Planctomycetota bacterium]
MRIRLLHTLLLVALIGPVMTQEIASEGFGRNDPGPLPGQSADPDGWQAAWQGSSPQAALAVEKPQGGGAGLMQVHGILARHLKSSAGRQMAQSTWHYRIKWRSDQAPSHFAIGLSDELADKLADTVPLLAGGFDDKHRPHLWGRGADGSLVSLMHGEPLPADSGGQLSLMVEPRDDSMTVRLLVLDQVNKQPQQTLEIAHWRFPDADHKRGPTWNHAMIYGGDAPMVIDGLKINQESRKTLRADTGIQPPPSQIPVALPSQQPAPHAIAAGGRELLPAEQELLAEPARDAAAESTAEPVPATTAVPEDAAVVEPMPAPPVPAPAPETITGPAPAPVTSTRTSTALRLAIGIGVLLAAIGFAILIIIRTDRVDRRLMQGLMSEDNEDVGLGSSGETRRYRRRLPSSGR